MKSKTGGMESNGINMKWTTFIAINIDFCEFRLAPIGQTSNTGNSCLITRFSSWDLQNVGQGGKFNLETVGITIGISQAKIFLSPKIG